MATQDSQNFGRNFAKRKQSDANFAPLRMVTIAIVINSALCRLTLCIVPGGVTMLLVSNYRQDCREAANCRY